MALIKSSCYDITDKVLPSALGLNRCMRLAAGVWSSLARALTLLRARNKGLFPRVLWAASTR